MMTRVMKDATVTKAAAAIFGVCGPSWLEDSYDHWSAAVRAWAVAKTRSLHDDDRWSIIYAIQELEDAHAAARAAEEDEEESVSEIEELESAGQ